MDVRPLRNLLVLMVFLFNGNLLLATTVAENPTLNELRGAWLGGTEANSEYLRLEIDATGHGVLTVQFLRDERARAYAIVSTLLSGGKIQFRLQPIGSAEPIFLHGYAERSELRLEVGSEVRQWHREVVLERELDVLSRIKAVKRRAKEFQDAGHR